MNPNLQTKRVLLVCSKYFPEYSGAGLRAQRTYARLAEKANLSYEVICSSSTAFSWRNAIYNVDGIRVTRISSPFKKSYLALEPSAPKFKRRLLYVCFGLDETLRTLWVIAAHYLKYDAFHTFGHCFPAGAAAIAAGLCGKPVLRELVTMQSRPDDPPGLRRAARWALRRNGCIVAISPKLAERARDLGYPSIWSRPNPVDTLRFKPVTQEEKAALRSQLTAFSMQDKLLLDISKYSTVKNKALLIRTLQHLPASYKLIVAGPLAEKDTALFESLRCLAKDLSIANRVTFLSGFIDNPEAYMQAADIFLFASLSDGLGTPILEALCCGTPVVAHRIPGVTDVWIEHSTNGCLAEPDPEAFAVAVLEAAAIPRENMLLSARDIAHQASTETIDNGYLERLRGERS